MAHAKLRMEVQMDKVARLLGGLTMATALALPVGIGSAFAQSHSHDHGSSVVLVDGEVRKVDKESGKVTIKHGEIKNLDMPPMTMVFRVKEPTMLDQLKAGDVIRFSVDKIGGQYTVTSVAPAK